PHPIFARVVLSENLAGLLGKSLVTSRRRLGATPLRLRPIRSRTTHVPDHRHRLLAANSEMSSQIIPLKAKAAINTTRGVSCMRWLWRADNSKPLSSSLLITGMATRPIFTGSAPATKTMGIVRDFITLLGGAAAFPLAARAACRANAADRVLVRRRESSHCSPYFRPLVLMFFMA